eukprot:6208664-Pleurochrysis_carterae.AAC.1
MPPRLGGGGERCTLCSGTVYPAEKLTSAEGRAYHAQCFRCTKYAGATSLTFEFPTSSSLRSCPIGPAQRTVAELKWRRRTTQHANALRRCTPCTDETRARTLLLTLEMRQRKQPC